jgi:hypothetical protein
MLGYVQYPLLNINEVMNCDVEPGAGDGLGKAVPLLKGSI